ncbi:MAG TPA: glycosyltransferase [Thermoleophilaceae bacterium]|nr:glycosyltransferase [Thermoleophilaceae bacterium]
MPDVRVSVVVPALDAEATLERCLAALSRQDVEGGFEVVVADDGSSDRTVEIARAAGPLVRVVEGPPGGPAAARNRGVDAARAPLVAFTDADCFPAPGWLAAGVAALDSADLVQGAVRADPEAERGPFDRTIEVGAERGLYETANLFVRREAFERAGGFEDWLPAVRGKPLGEDVWLGWRVRRAGGRIAFSPEALVHHAVFRRRAAEFVAERRRLVHFPAFARQVPELRRVLFTARVFLSPRTAALDAALAGLAAAALVSPFALAALLPYAWTVARDAAPWRGQRLKAALVGVAADLAGLTALLEGSVRFRSPVL